jgi:transposase
VQRPTMKFVATKTAEQLDLQALHRVRERLISQRTGIINQIRAFLLERGVAVRQGLRFLRAELPRILATPCDALSPRVHIHGAPTGDAAELKIRPTTTPSASTSKSSSFHSPEGREDRALLRINWVTARVLI